MDNSWSYLAKYSIVGDFTKPTTPSAWGPGLRFSTLCIGLGALGIISYKILDWEYIKSSCWALRIASSSLVTTEVDTSLDIYGNRDLRNHSSKNLGGMVALIRFFRILHSWMWSEIWVALSYWKVDNKSIPKSYQTRSWKWLRNTLAKSQKLSNATKGSSMYHFAAVLVRVLWNNLNQTMLSFSELEEHHKWKVVMWAPGSSPTLPSNFGIFEGNLVGIGG